MVLSEGQTHGEWWNTKENLEMYSDKYAQLIIWQRYKSSSTEEEVVLSVINAGAIWPPNAMKWTSISQPYTNIDPKWIMRLSVKTIVKKHKRKYLGFKLRREFIELIPKA